MIADSAMEQGEFFFHQCRVIVLGDDCVVLCPSSLARYHAARLRDYPHQYGFFFKSELREDLRDVEFCSSIFVPMRVSRTEAAQDEQPIRRPDDISIQSVLVPKPGRVLMKAFFSLVLRRKANAVKWAKVVAAGLHHDMGAMPLIGPLLHVLSNGVSPGTWMRTANVHKLHVAWSDVTIEQSDETVEYFCNRYNLTDDDLDRLTDLLISASKPAGTPWLVPDPVAAVLAVDL